MFTCCTEIFRYKLTDQECSPYQRFLFLRPNIVMQWISHLTPHSIQHGTSKVLHKYCRFQAQKMHPELAIISSEMSWIWDIYFGAYQSHLHSCFTWCNFPHLQCSELPKPLVILRSEYPYSLNEHGRDMYHVKSCDKVTDLCLLRHHIQ